MSWKRHQIPDALMDYFELDDKVSVHNTHPTVKPVELMEHLLQDFPKDIGPILDPFMGSGTTGVACISTGHDFIGIERDPEYLGIADARIRHWDRAECGWTDRIINSDHQPKESQKPVDGDLFGEE